MTYKCKDCHCKCHCNEELHADVYGVCTCDNCSCKCHCGQELHADVYGVCTCDNCSCGRKKEEVVDDTQECDVCQ